MSDTDLNLSRWKLIRLNMRELITRGEGETYRSDLWLALPAMLCGLLIVVAIVFLLLQSHREVIARYRQQAAKARQDKDYAAARLCYERLVREDPADKQAMFDLAAVLAEMGQGQSALELLDRLAPLDATGFAPAHLALAKQLLAATQPSVESVHAAEQHLLRALEAQGELVEAHALLGRVYASAGKWELARPHLLAALKNSDELALLMAQVSAALSRQDDARAFAQRAVAFWSARAQALPTDTAVRLAWAQSLMALGDYGAAMTVLERGLVLAENRVLRHAAGQICAAWLKRLEQNPAGDPALAVDLLTRGLKHDPSNAELLRRLVVLSRLTGPRSDQARRLLNDLLAQGHDSAMLHLVLGSDSVARGQLMEARVHFERAWSIDPHLPEVGNNLAWLLAFGERPDEKRAMTLIESAIQSQPENLHFRDTRGQILAKEGRWQEAIADLEAALPVLEDARATHATLADCYIHLGMNDLADAHRRLSAPQQGSATVKPATTEPFSAPARR